MNEILAQYPIIVDVQVMFSKPIAIYFAKDLSEQEIEVVEVTHPVHYLDNTEE